MPAEMQTLVIGFGNTLRGDDALGRIACQQLRTMVEARRVRVVDQAAPTPELAADVASAALVIFIDAAHDGPRDTIATRRLTSSSPRQTMAHRIDPGTLVALAGHVYRRQPPAYLISFRGRSFDLCDNRLSPEAEAACKDIIQRTLELIEREGQRADRASLASCE